MSTEAYSYTIALVLFIFVVVVLYVVRRAAKPVLIDRPVLGLLDLSGGGSAVDASADRAILEGLFHSLVKSTSHPPQCDVLFVYCQLKDDGRIDGCRLGLRELIRNSGARIAVVASKNSAEACLAASKQTGYGSANPVLTFDRKDELFGLFFHKLFSAMKQGTPMPLAWVQLAP